MRRINFFLSLCCMLLLGTMNVWAQTFTTSPAPTNGVFDENTTWYYIYCPRAGYWTTDTQYLGDNGYFKASSAQTGFLNEDTHWCIVGDETNGYTFYNKAKGASYVLGTNTSANRVAMYESASVDGSAVVATYWRAYSLKGGNNEWECFRIGSTGNNYWNYMNHSGSYLSLWNSGSAITGSNNAGDDGSAFKFEAVPSAEEALTDFYNELSGIISKFETRTEDPGCYGADAISAAKIALENEKSIVEDAAATDEARKQSCQRLQAAKNTLEASAKNPITDGSYKIVNAVAKHVNAGKEKAVYTNGNQLLWGDFDDVNGEFYWKLIKVSEDSIILQSSMYETYMNSATSINAEPRKATFEMLAAGQYRIKVNNQGLHMSGWNNNESGNMMHYDQEGANSASAWMLMKVEDKSLATMYADAKASAQEYINGLEPYIKDEPFYLDREKVDALEQEMITNAVTPTTNEEYKTAIEDLLNISVGEDCLILPADGKYLIKCVARNTADGNYLSIHNNGYLYANATKATRSVWQFTAVEGGYTLQNVLTGKYPQGASESKQVALSDSPYTLHLYPAPGGNYGKTAIGDDGNRQKYHESGSNTIVGWESGAGASQWIFEPYTDDMAESLATAENGLCGTPAAVAAAPILGVSGPSSSSYTLNDILEGSGPEKEVYAKAAGKYYRITSASGLDGHKIDGQAAVIGIDRANNRPCGVAASSGDIDAIWQFIPSENGVKIYSPNYKKYIGAVKQTNSPMTECAKMKVEEEGEVYSIVVVDETNKKFQFDGATCSNINMEGGDRSYVLDQWHQSGSHFTLAEVETVDVELLAAVAGEAYATAYLPFDVTVPAGDVKAYVGDAFTAGDTYISMTEATEVKAENGFILKGTAAGNVTLTIGATDAKESALSGTLTALPKSESYLVLGLADGKVGFYGMGDALTEIAANKAFLNNASGNAVRMLFGDGNLTGIEAIENGELTIDNGTVYDLSGRAVNAPIKGGVYIKNGKKFIVK